MKKVLIGLAVGLLAMATVGVVSAQGRVDTPCAGYAVEVQPATRTATICC